MAQASDRRRYKQITAGSVVAAVAGALLALIALLWFETTDGEARHRLTELLASIAPLAIGALLGLALTFVHVVLGALGGRAMRKR
jgi:hypothetical protein